MLAFSVLATALLSTLLVPGTVVGRLLGSLPIRAFGQRAFALYLWHYPTIMLMGANRGDATWEMTLAAVAVSLVAAELSLRLVERPFARLIDGREVGDSRFAKAAPIASSALVLACAAYSCYALVAIPPEYLVPEDAIVSTGKAAGEAMDVPGRDDGKPAREKDGENRQGPPPAPKPPVTVTDRTIVTASPEERNRGIVDPLVIGDSVPGDAGDDMVPDGMGWQTRLPDAWVDTYIGRMPGQALDVLHGYLDQGVVGKVVVMACFSNTTPAPETLNDMIAAVGSGRQLYLVGTINSDGFQDDANANLIAAADAHDNVHYVDWPVVLDGRFGELLWADDTHLRPEGAREYVDMIVRAVAQDLVNGGGAATER